MGSTGTRELLVLKLLEERRKNAARLQQQLYESLNESQEEEGDENNQNDGIDYDNKNEEVEFGQNEEEVGGNNKYGNDERLFRPASGRQYNNAEEKCIFLLLFFNNDNIKELTLITFVDSDITTEDLEGHSSSHPSFPSSSSSSFVAHPPPFPPQHPTRSNNLKQLKQHLQQPQYNVNNNNNNNNNREQSEQEMKRQMDLNAFDSAFQKIQANVYGRNTNKPTLDSKGILLL